MDGPLDGAVRVGADSRGPVGPPPAWRGGPAEGAAIGAAVGSSLGALLGATDGDGWYSFDPGPAAAVGALVGTFYGGVAGFVARPIDVYRPAPPETVAVESCAGPPLACAAPPAALGGG